MRAPNIQVYAQRARGVMVAISCAYMRAVAWPQQDEIAGTGNRQCSVDLIGSEGINLLNLGNF